VKFLVDADVLSEPTKPLPHARAITWLRENEPELAVNPIVLGEIEYGILLLPPSRKRTRLHDWFAEVVQAMRFLDFDMAAASAWAGLLARLRKKGLAMPINDSLIAASALVHGLSVATRNTADYRHAGVPLINPFDH
jgi:predicted nucleic acid-binding protein